MTQPLQPFPRSVAAPFVATRMSRRVAVAGFLGVGLATLAGATKPLDRAGAATAASAHAAALEYPEIVVTATDHHFAGIPAEMAGGLTRLTLDNRGQSDHHIMVMRFNAGVSLADFSAATREPGFEAILTAATSVGGPMGGPGERGTVLVDLAPGDYAAICAVPGADGMPHFASGMLSPFTVSGSAATTEPQYDRTVELVEFGFGHLHEEVSAGPQVWKVPNAGAQIHELVLFRLAPGISQDRLVELLAAMASGEPPAEGGQPPFAIVGGVSPLYPDQTNWALLDLAPGDYAAVCFAPDPATGVLHLATGMLMPFSVE